jgi:hypothetical protein
VNPGEEASRFLEPRFGAALAIWWAWTWRWLLYAAAGNFVLYVPMLGINLILGGTHRVAEVVGFVAGILLVCAAQVYTLWNLFGHDFRDFELCLESKAATGSDPVFAPSLRDAIRIWWAWFWRHFVITFGLGIVLGFVLGMVAGATGLSMAELNNVGLLLNVVLAAAVALFVVYIILRHDFRTSRIRLMRVPVA